MIKVVSVENMRKSDANTITNGTPSRELMERAGNAIFNAAEWNAPVAIVCGIGNNAGDGFVVAELLYNAKIECKLFLLSDKFSDDGQYFFERCKAAGVAVANGIDELALDGYNTILDCIFGTGFHGEITKPYSTAIAKINAARTQGAYVISADINSGISGDSGLDNECCVHSDLTVSIGCYKSGHFLNSAKDVMKKKINCDIGIEPVDEPAYLIEASDISRLFERPVNNTNKGDYGYVALIGGSLEYSGAAKLANLSLSALRAGAGVAKLAVPRRISNAVLPYLLESTLFELDDVDGSYSYSHTTTARLLNRTRAAAVGMGMGRSPEIKRLLEYLLCEYSGRAIIDADGLNMLAEMDKKYFKNASCRLILTPHPKEFERLSGVSIDEFSGDLISAAKNYASSTGAILLLKGTTTIVTDGKTVYLIDRGSNGMATAGSGDVLSGILTGICGYVSDDDLLLGVAAGAYLNGLAGELAARDIPSASMIAGDTVKHIAEAVKNILA
ncbi:MAG: NAD(P)H-hydrate dehydratase [Clostridiales bacterium]|nr:NAD(P)H-hydrate dehydratase [Clostridiales bacterium]